MEKSYLSTYTAQYDLLSVFQVPWFVDRRPFIHQRVGGRGSCPHSSPIESFPLITFRLVTPLHGVEPPFSTAGNRLRKERKT